MISVDKQSLYEEYTDLICKRDVLDKQADSIQLAYTKEFGQLLKENFELKIECIKKKRMIAYCGKQINRGLPIDILHVGALIENELALYYDELRELIARNESAKRSVVLSDYRVRAAKRIYHRLVKKLHPDYNRKTEESSKLKEIWDSIDKAYKKTDVDALSDLEALATRVLEELGEKGFEADYPDIEERIQRLERQISEILNSEPYTYRELLYDKTKVKQKKEELKAEGEEYRKYVKELTETLDKLIGGGGAKMVWRMG